MTYDFAYDFETLPTFGGVFDFRLCLRLSTFEKIFRNGLRLSLALTCWYGMTRRMVRAGWWDRADFRVFAGGAVEKPGTVENQGFSGCWWAFSVCFPVFAVPVYGLVYAIFRACNGAILRFTGLYVS